ncbi:hypothetical protein A0O34_15075 [Chryseobacterium glaciei]|uniref:Uncharacterized protein n=1 Tax=Chryseobacterium glaciei TaxID=1685010 RepID=A0A172XXX7_9FLAO|nr:hypothetical protein [Chryseobacterium glaciei]ANF51746.1 hypothetical protein A0O34_15075 [Chryseobacterium glaciei]
MDIVKFTKDSIFQKIKAWYIDESSVTLSEKDLKRKDRISHAWSLRKNNKYSPSQVIQIVVRDHNVSESTAYRDYSMAMNIFGDLDQVNVAAERLILAESYWNLYQMSLKKGNEETARKCLDSYKSLFNFADTEQKIDPKKLEASVYKLNLPRGAKNMLEAMFQTGVADFNNITAQDVSWKEVDNNEEDTEDDGD